VVITCRNFNVLTDYHFYFLNRKYFFAFTETSKTIYEDCTQFIVNLFFEVGITPQKILICHLFSSEVPGIENLEQIKFFPFLFELVLTFFILCTICIHFMIVCIK